MKALAIVSVLLLPVSCTGTQQKAAFNNTFVANAVKAKLIGIDADALTSVTVTASDGAVTLTGQAHDQREKDRYVAAARSVGDVTSVDDRLGINPNLHGLREGTSDVALAGRVSGAIAAQTGVNVFNLHVSSNAGVITVAGHVPSQSIERTVVDTARSVPGVKRVISRIVIRQ